MRCLLWVLVVLALTPAYTTAAQGRPPSETNPTRLARLGSELAVLGDLANARRYCDLAISSESANAAAIACLKDVAARERAAAAEQADRTEQVGVARTRQLIAQAEALVRAGASDRVIDVYGAAAGASTDATQLDAISRRLDGVARASFLSEMLPGWAPDLIFAILFLIALYVMLLLIRFVVRVYRVYRLRLPKGISLVAETRWRLRPLDDNTGLAVTELLADALLKDQKSLLSEAAVPTLLPLCPHDTEPHEPQVCRNFRVPETAVASQQLASPVIAVAPTVDLADAIGALQLKVGGVDIGSLAKFVSGARSWFDAGLPVIAGSAMLVEGEGTARELVIRLVKSGGSAGVVTIVSSAAVTGELANGIDAAREATERAAFKLNCVLKNAHKDADLDGLACWQQAILLLQRHITEGAASGIDRDKGLACAARNLRFARSVEQTKWKRARQALFEGVTHALLASGDRAGQERSRAIDLFRTVEDMADLAEPVEALLRAQAIYNRATVEKQLNDPLNLDRALRRYEGLIVDLETKQRSAAEEVMLLLSRCALVIATRQLSTAQFGYLQRERVSDWLNQAALALKGIESPLASDGSDARFAKAVGIEVNRAYAALILRDASDFQHLPLPTVSKLYSEFPKHQIPDAIKSLQLVERAQPPEPQLYVQLTFAHLLNSDVDEARRAAQRGIAMGGKDQILYYAMALDAFRNQDYAGALAHCRAVPDKTLPEFVELEGNVPSKPGEAGRHSYLDHIKV